MNTHPGTVQATEFMKQDGTPWLIPSGQRASNWSICASLGICYRLYFWKTVQSALSDGSHHDSCPKAMKLEISQSIVFLTQNTFYRNNVSHLPKSIWLGCALQLTCWCIISWGATRPRKYEVETRFHHKFSPLFLWIQWNNLVYTSIFFIKSWGYDIIHSIGYFEGTHI